MPNNIPEVAVRFREWTVGWVKRDSQFTTDVLCIPEGGEAVDELPAVHLLRRRDAQLLQVRPEKGERPNAILEGGVRQLQAKMTIQATYHCRLDIRRLHSQLRDFHLLRDALELRSRSQLGEPLVRDQRRDERN